MQQLKIANHTALSLGVFFCLLLSVNVYAQIATDGSVGPAQNLTGPDFSIPENLGSRAGANLFHSFQDFNIQTGQSATFSGSNTIANVISRVTGGNPSNINGLLRSTIALADFYFLNPAGVMFGANAQVDVPGSFYVSTANELRFSDGSIYSATNPAASTMIFAPPESFGFLGDHAATISVVGSDLVLNPENTLSLSSGQIAIDQANLLSGPGEIQLIATGDINSDTRLALDGELSTPATGNLTIKNSTIDTFGDGAGRIVVRSGVSEFNSSNLFAQNTGSTHASSQQGIDIHATSLNISSSVITTDTFRQGHGADLSVTVAGDLSILNSELLSRTGGSGNAGNVTVTVDDVLSIVNGGRIESSTFDEGHAGQLTVTAGHLTIDGNGSVETGIVSDARSFLSTGKAGNITVTANDSLSIVNGGIIGSTTTSFSAGTAADVTVNARQLNIDGMGSGLLTAIFSDTSSLFTVKAGTVNVNVLEELSVNHARIIRSRTEGAGDAGEVIVNAGSLIVNGNGQSGVFTGIANQANTGATGDAGDLTVTVVDRISLSNGGSISNSTFASGDAGNLSVTARELAINSKGSGVFTGIASNASSGSSGNAGNTTVTIADQIEIANGGQISSSTSAVCAADSACNAGDVIVNAGQLIIDGKGTNFTTTITSQANPNSTGNAGNVDVNVAADYRYWMEDSSVLLRLLAVMRVL